jgi:hypothetical protein
VEEAAGGRGRDRSEGLRSRLRVENQGQKNDAERAIGGYYLNAAQHGELPGRGREPSACSRGQVVERAAYNAVYQQFDARTSDKLSRSRAAA